MSPIRTLEALRCMWHGHPTSWVAESPAMRGGRLQPALRRHLICEFAETDYCYGIGPLTIKLDRIDWDRPVPFEGDTWLEVEGVLIDGSGREGARREVLVRAHCLPPRPIRKRPRLRP
ncbi:hypothetical protein AB0M54_39645 [Actinoplanes sp. NPDC051470]|uniref:hypothetical protein n=1 Tax=unclassified Actinoplanes TaxID=2626549 RepID=UPI00343FB78C